MAKFSQGGSADFDDDDAGLDMAVALGPSCEAGDTSEKGGQC